MLTQAYSSVGMYNWPLLDMVSRAARSKLHDFDEISVVNLTSAFARLKFNVRDTFYVSLSWSTAFDH
jgi:hypothetical protein